MLKTLKLYGSRLEMWLAGPLPPLVRSNMYIELPTSLAYGVFYAAGIAFLPVVLRRSGATETMLAIYVASQFLGSVLTPLSLRLIRKFGAMRLLLSCWLLGRLSFLLWAFVSDATWMLWLAAYLWILEPFPGPAYARIFQQIYPSEVRGKVMSLVRMGRGVLVLLLTPIAGWVLDVWGYRILFPVAALVGALSAWFFAQLKLDDTAQTPPATTTLGGLWRLAQEDRRYAFYLLTFTLFGIGTLLAWTIYPLVQVDRFNISYSQLGLLEMAGSITWLIGYFWFGRLVDRRGGLYVMRMTVICALFVPSTYLLAQNGWMLLPAFIAQGFVNAGFEMGPLNAAIELSNGKRVTEYAAMQSMMIGLRGLIIPLISVQMFHRVGAAGVFSVSLLFMIIALLMFGQVRKSGQV